MAPIIELKEHTSNSESSENYDFVTGYGKTNLVINYIKNHQSELRSKEDKERFAMGYLNCCPKDIKEDKV